MFTQEEEDFLKKFVEVKQLEHLIEEKTLTLDAFRQDLYSQGEKKVDVDAQAKPFEDEIKQLQFEKTMKEN